MVARPFLIGGFVYQDENSSYVYHADFLSAGKFLIGILVFSKLLRKIL